MIINKEQFEALRDFHTSLWVHSFKPEQCNSDFDGEFWLKKLDGLQIPWSVQNVISHRAQNDYGSVGVYFSTLCRMAGIQVKNV